MYYYLYGVCLSGSSSGRIYVNLTCFLFFVDYLCPINITMEDNLFETVEVKEEHFDYDDGSSIETKPDVFDIHESLASGVSNEVPEVMQFMDPADVLDTSTSSAHVDEIDPLSDIKLESHSCCVSVQQSGMEDAIQNSSCVCGPPTGARIRPCFVHVLHVDTPLHVPDNVHQLIDAGPLPSQSSDAVLSQAEYSEVGTLQGMYSGTETNMQVHDKGDQQHDFITSVTIQEDSNRHLYCENCAQTITHSAHNTIPVRGHLGDTSKCISCQKLFSNKDHLEPHVDMQLSNHLDQYLPSDKESPQDSKLKPHLQTPIDEFPYMCTHCDKTFTQKCNLKRHIRFHIVGRPYQCSQCDKAFTHNCDLKRHMRFHTGERSHQCSQCDMAFAEHSNLKQHMKYHTKERPYHCPQCDKTFAENSYLTIHMRIHTGQRPYQCSQCTKSFKHHSTLKRHMLYHTGERPYQCSHCDKTFTQDCHLKRHMALHSRVQPYQCSQCGKASTNESMLKKHMRIHRGEPPYQCPQCNKGFVDSSNLKRHVRLHSGERAYKCSQCDKAFADYSNRKKHMRVHAGETPH